MLQELGIFYKTNRVFVDEARRDWSRKESYAVVYTKSKKVIDITILAAISY